MLPISRALVAIPLLLAACGPADSDPDRAAPDETAAQAVTEARAEASQSMDGVELSAVVPGSLIDEVATRNGSVVLGVTDTVLYSRLSDDLQAEVADEMGDEIGDDEGFGANLARTITGAVAEGLRTAVSVPLADIRDLRVEDGRLVVEMADGDASPFADASIDGTPLLESFDADAASRIAEAFDKATR